ncbi:MAG: HAD-IIB family hydrolase [Erysipelotrichaceae bacterium]|nr:HAD-IIB family hydrolase [Erysipelotrichaceae bacterium]
MKKISTVICDLDGTLLNSFKDVSKANHNILSALAAKDVILGLASGRDIEQIEENMDRWGLDDKISFIIGSNGCEYKNRCTGRYVRQGFMPKAVLKTLKPWLRESGLVWGVKYKGRIYWDHFSFYALLLSLADGQKSSYSGFSNLQETELNKIILVGSPGRIAKAKESFHMDGFRLIPVGRFSLEIVADGVSKFEGLKRAMEDFPVNPQDTLTFGDDYNDVELVSSTYGVAMKNAILQVILAAKDRTKYGGPQDGVAYHLNSMMISGRYSFEKPGQTEPAARESSETPVRS